MVGLQVVAGSSSDASSGGLDQLDLLVLTIVGTVVDPVHIALASKDIGFAVRVFIVEFLTKLGDFAHQVGGDDLLENSLRRRFITGEGVSLRTMDEMEVTGVLAVNELFFNHGVSVCLCVCMWWEREGEGILSWLSC